MIYPHVSHKLFARMAESVDAVVSKATTEKCEGSTPSSCTMQILVNFRRAEPSSPINPRVPLYLTDGSSGLDLSACLAYPIKLRPGAIVRVPTGWCVEIPPGFEGQIRARSSIAGKGIIVPNAPGTVDWDYRGEIQVLLMNLTRDDFDIDHGDRIAQLVICPVEKAKIEVVDVLTKTQRGSGGFGSTGK